MEGSEQRRMINEAASRLAEALVASYRRASDPSSAQRSSVELTERFFEAVIECVRRRQQGIPEDGEEAARRIPDDRQRGQLEAAQALQRRSDEAYREFLDSLAFYSSRNP